MRSKSSRGFEQLSRHCVALLAVVLMLGGSLWSVASSKAHAQGETSDLFEFKEPGVEFSIRVPPKWKVQPGSQGFAVTMKPSEKAERKKLPGGMIADPSLTVAAVKKPVKFDEQFLEALALEIEENFVRYNGKGTGFQIFQKNIVSDLPGGRKGLLYYVSFSTEGVPAGQAILITGNESVRYRVTLSDHRLNFDRNLEAYYPYMVSLDFKDPQPVASSGSGLLSQDILLWSGLVVVAGGLLGFTARARRSRGSTRASSRRSSSKASAAYSLAPTQVSASPSEVSAQPSSVGGSINPSQSDVSLSTSNSESPEQPEQSMIPMSMIGLTSQPADSRAAVDMSPPAFTEKDLSGPPQSVPLSQVVDESSAPPDMKKRWQIFGNPTKK